MTARVLKRQNETDVRRATYSYELNVLFVSKCFIKALITHQESDLGVRHLLIYVFSFHLPFLCYISSLCIYFDLGMLGLHVYCVFLNNLFCQTLHCKRS